MSKEPYDTARDVEAFHRDLKERPGFYDPKFEWNLYRYGKWLVATEDQRSMRQEERCFPKNTYSILRTSEHAPLAFRSRAMGTEE